MSNGRNTRGKGGGGGGGGSGQQRRRRGRPTPQMPRGPVMTALGESTYEAVFDHGNEGYGVWFDGVVREDPVYRQFWKGSGTRPIYVKLEQDRITITREQPNVLRSTVDEPTEQDDSPSGIDSYSGPMVFDPDPAPAAAEEAAEPAADDDRVYTPEEAALLFAAGTADEPAADDAPASEDAEPAPARRTTTRRTSTRTRRTTKAEAADDAADTPAAEDAD